MRKMNMGGSVPRQTTIQGQRHDLAYINPFEVDLLESYNATPGGVAGPGNVPAYPPGGSGGYGGYDGGFGEAGRGGQDSDAPGMGPGDGGGMGEGPGGIDIGFMNALADQVAEEEAAAVAESNAMMSPLGGADAIARQNLVDSFMDTKDGRDLAMFNDSSAYVSPQNQQIAQDNQQTLNLYDDVVDFNTSPLSGNILSNDIEFNEGLVASSDPTQAYLDSLTKPSIQTGANNFIDAVAMQQNDPNQSTTGPFTGFNIVDAANLSAGTVTPNMMPPGYQPTPNEPTFDDLMSDPNQISINPLDNISSTLGSPIDPVVGLGTTVDPDLNYSLPVAATPADPNFLDIVGNQGISPTLGQPGSINLNAQMPTGIQDPSGLSSFNNMTGIDDSSFSTPIGVETGMQDPSQVATGIINSPQLDESARDAIAAARTGDNLNPQGPNFTPAGFQDMTGLTGEDLDMPDGISLNSGINPQGPNFTPTTLGLDEAARGQALADRNALENREASLDYTNTSATPEVDPGPMQGPYNQTDDMRTIAAKNRQLSEAMRVAEAGVQNQEDIANAGFNPLSLLPFGSLLGTPESRKQTAINQVISQSGGSGIFGSGVGGSKGLLGTGAVTFNAVYDGDGNFVGSQGVSESGETVSYSGNMQGNNGYFDGDGNNISENIEGYQEEIGGQGSPGGIDVDYNPCQPGYELDPESGTCVPIDVVAESGPPTLGPIIRPVTPTTVTPDPVASGPVSSPTLVTPKQFNMGGATSGSNLDGAIGRLLSSMS